MINSKLMKSLTIRQLTYRFASLQCILILILYIGGQVNMMSTLLMGTVILLSAHIIVRFVKYKHASLEKDTIEILSDTNDMADQTKSILKHGLDEASAKYVVDIVKTISNAPAVSITDKENVLAFIGEGCDMHPIGYPIRTQATLDSITDGKLRIIENKTDFNCKLSDCNCPLETAIIVPLVDQDETIGCLKLYGVKKESIKDNDVKLAIGIGKILSRQIELASIDKAKQLATEAKLEALEAQVNPHFLFNALNAVNMYIHKDPVMARELVLKLSSMLRYILGKYGKFITVEEEVEHIRDFLVIENARYQNTIDITFHMDEDVNDCELPILTIHPLVNNAITHGILPSGKSGEVIVSIKKRENTLKVSVKDNGIGIKEENMERIFEPNFGQGCGIGIPNVDNRLKLIYGDEYGLKIDSIENVGTEASFHIPLA